MASGFKLANPTEYRRGVILGLTLAEVLMLLVFLLLLSSSALLERRAREAAALRANIARYDSLLAPLLAREIKLGVSVKDSDQLVSLIVRGQQAEQLRRELDRKTSELAAAKSVAEGASKEIERLRSELSNTPEAKRAMAAKAADDDEMRAILSRAGSAGDTPSDALRRLLDRTERTAASDQNLTGQNAQMRAELARLKGNGGSGLPYCWTTLDGKPIYMFKVDLRDGGVIAHNVEPRPRPEDDAWRLVSSVQRDAMVPISAFLAQVAPLGAAGVAAKCRYAVLAVDGTASTNKPGYKSLMGHLWSAFMVREVGR